MDVVILRKSVFKELLSKKQAVVERIRYLSEMIDFKDGFPTYLSVPNTRRSSSTTLPLFVQPIWIRNLKLSHDFHMPILCNGNQPTISLA